jgi:hypothetical protein
MSEKIVPKGMLDAAADVYHEQAQDGVDMMAMSKSLEAALHWLSENPIIPTDEQVADMRNVLAPVNPHWANIIAVWIRRMFDTPEIAVPDEIKDLLLIENTRTLNDPGYHPDRKLYNNSVIEAFHRGLKAR